MWYPIAFAQISMNDGTRYFREARNGNDFHHVRWAFQGFWHSYGEELIRILDARGLVHCQATWMKILNG
jgi:hypothetical protein